MHGVQSEVQNFKTRLYFAVDLVGAGKKATDKFERWSHLTTRTLMFRLNTILVAIAKRLQLPPKVNHGERSHYPTQDSTVNCMLKLKHAMPVPALGIIRDTACCPKHHDFTPDRDGFPPNTPCHHA